MGLRCKPSETMLKKRNRAGDLTLPDSKTYCDTTEVKAVWCCPQTGPQPTGAEQRAQKSPLTDIVK